VKKYNPSSTIIQNIKSTLNPHLLQQGYSLLNALNCFWSGSFLFLNLFSYYSKMAFRYISCSQQAISRALVCSKHDYIPQQHALIVRSKKRRKSPPNFSSYCHFLFKQLVFDVWDRIRHRYRYPWKH